MAVKFAEYTACEKKKKSKYSEQQIALALKQAELVASVSEVRRKLEVAERTFYCCLIKLVCSLAVRYSICGK